MIRLRRAYETAAPGDGARFLVARLWPRGVKKTNLPIEAWLKDIAPSATLRQWYQHDRKKWPEVRKRYVAERQTDRSALQPLLTAATRGTVTLVYSARDTERNSALVLRDYLETLLGATR
jgi:uncharacterized protein YeaO (DUF488 family)